MTRATFEERVHIDRRTLTRWISEGLLTPGRVRRDRYWMQTFTAEDVRFARALLWLLKSRRGELTLQHAAAIVRNEVAPPDPGHDPKDVPPLTHRSRDYPTAEQMSMLKLFIEKHSPPADERP